MVLKRFNFLWQAKGKIEFERGVRALLTIAVPVIIGRWLGQPSQGMLAGFCAVTFILADVGGLYSVRAKALLGTMVGVVLALAIGTLIDSEVGLMMVSSFLWLFLTGYLTVYGENGAAVGLVIGLAFLLAINLPSGGIDLAFERASLVFLGGSWAIILSLFIWPFQPNKPLRQMVARNFQNIARHLQTFSLTNPVDRENPSFTQVRQSLLQSRQTLVNIRQGRLGRSDLRELLVVLIEDSDRLMTTLSAIQELLLLHPLPQLTTTAILVEDSFKQVAQITESIAALILGKNQLPDCDRLKRLIDAVAQQQSLQRQALTQDLADYQSWVAIEQLSALLQKLQQQLRFATQTARDLRQRDSRRQVHRTPEEAPFQASQEKKWWEPLQENLNLESPLFRHALRLGLGSALGIAIYSLGHIPHGFWVGLTLVIVLKPDFSVTFQRFFNRIVGTILGIGAAAGILYLLHHPFWLEAIAFASIAIALSIVRFQYSVAVFFITIYALIITTLNPDNATVNSFEARIVCTLIGGAIALVLSYGLWRPKEEELFSHAAAAAIEQVNQYFRAVMAVYLGESDYQLSRLNEKRDRARLANNKAQAALQRLLDDPSTPFARMEPAITLAYYVPRLGRAITVLLTQLEHYSGSPPHPNVARFTEEVTQSLAQLEESLAKGMLPPNLPPLETTLEGILSHLQDLQKERLGELANRQDNTPVHRYLNDYNIFATDLQEIVRRIQALHTALQRFETAT